VDRFPRAGGQAALGAHLSLDICQDKQSDMSCVDLRRSSHPSSYMLCRIRKLKPLPLSCCLPSARGDCWRIVLRSCRMGIRFSEVDSTGEMTMLEFLKVFISVRVRIPYCRAAASVLRVTGLSADFQCSRQRIERLPPRTWTYC